MKGAPSCDGEGCSATALGSFAVSGRRFLVVLVVIGLAAFAGRAAYVVAVTRHTPGPAPLGVTATHVRTSFDELGYQVRAVRLAGGEGFIRPFFGPPDENATHPPLTTVALASVALVSGDSEVAMRLAVAAAGAVVVLLIGLVARAVAGARAGLLAAAIAAVYPNLWVNDGLMMSETWATLGTAATVLLAYRLLRGPGLGIAAATGAAAAAAMLSRSELALLVPVLVVPAALLAGGSWSTRLRLGAVAVGAAVLVAAPWVAYNLSRFDRPVLLSHGDGDVLAGANCDTTYGGELFGFWDGRCGFLAEAHEPSVEGALRRERGLRYMGDHLGRLPVVAAARLGRVTSTYRTGQMIDLAEGEGKPAWATTTGLAMYWLLMVPAVVGGFVLRRRRVPILPLLVPVVVVLVNAALFYGLVRFRAPAEVSLVVLAAVGIEALVRREGVARAMARP